MNAVVELVAREGLAAATVRRIASELSCSPGQIHHHFESAEDLRAEAVREVWRRIEPQLVASLNRMPPRERLLAVSSCSMSMLSDELRPIMVMAERLWKEAWDTQRCGAVKEAVAEGITKMREEICATLNEGIRTGVFSADVDVPKLSLRMIAASQGYDLLAEFGIEKELGPDKTSYMNDILVMEGID